MKSQPALCNTSSENPQLPRQLFASPGPNRRVRSGAAVGITLLSLFLLLTAVLANAVVRDVSTGIGIKTGGVPDTIWQVDQAGGGVAPAQTVFPGDPDWGINAWVPNNPPNSSWIARDANSCCNGKAPYTFTTTFYVDNPSIASISGSWTIDDEGILALNGHVVDSLGGGSWTSLHPFSAAGSQFFVPGINVLTITITSTDDYLEGVRLEGSVTNATAAGWQPLIHQPPARVGAVLQLRDGRVLVHGESYVGPTGSANWYTLTPDSNGSYLNGQWGSGGTLPPGYGPLWFGSQVLLDGKSVVIEGGEYNFTSKIRTNLGAIATVVPHGAISWTPNTPPIGWSTIGNGPSIILPNGTYMQGNCCTQQTAYFKGPNLWTAGPSVNSVSNEYQGWTLLPTDSVLTVDASPSCTAAKGTERYHGNHWYCETATNTQLYDAVYDPKRAGLGAAVLMYNGKVLQFGGLPSATEIFDPDAETWTIGPNPLLILDQPDGPASLEPNGKVLAMLSNRLDQTECHMVEYDPSMGPIGAISGAPNPEDCRGDGGTPSWMGHLMILPTGQILFTNLTGAVEIYTPQAGYLAATQPFIAIGQYVSKGAWLNRLAGYNINGLTQNNAYGDDYQADTNYPLIRLMCGGTAYYANTHGESTHSIRPGTIATTDFDLDPATPLSANCDLQLIANGVPSNIQTVMVVK